MALSKERCSIAEIVDAATTAVSRFYASKQLYLVKEVTPDLPLVFCDRTRIREVLLNLLSNAARFTESGGVRVSAHRDGNDVLFSVADTGPGIASDQINKLFQPFEQLDGSIRRRYGGSGLGLSISKGFVELHGGSMWIESSLGAGATVFFRLPIDAPTPLDQRVARWLNPEWEFRERTRASLAPTPNVRPRMSLVESGKALGRMAGRYFDGVELVTHETLSAAIAETGEAPVQAIVINAASVAVTLNSTVARSDLPAAVPVIISSLPETVDVAQDLGASNYLIKPLVPDQVLSVLQGLKLRRKTILAVDDEPEALTLLLRLLSRQGAGYRVLTATNGREALEIMRRRRVAAVLLDLVMPEMDGFRVLEECRRDANLRTIPIVIMSARDPVGQPIVSSAVAVTQKGGLSAQQFLTCVDALRTILGPGAPPGDRGSPTELPG
jgi:CheY-like chemotaxis protein